MSSTKKIAEEISVLMPVIARRIFSRFFQTIRISQTQIFTIMTLHEGACQLHPTEPRLALEIGAHGLPP